MADALAWERLSPAHRKRDRLALAASGFAGLGLLKMLSGHLEAVSGLHSLPSAILLMVLPGLGCSGCFSDGTGARGRGGG